MESEQRDSVRELRPAHNLNKQINKQLVNILIKLRLVSSFTCRIDSFLSFVRSSEIQNFGWRNVISGDTKVCIAVMILNYKRLKLLNSISDILLLNECAN